MPSLANRLATLVPASVRQSFLLKFALAFAVVIGAIGVIGVTAYDQTTRQLNDEAATELRTTARLEAETLEDWREKNRRLTRMLSKYRVMSEEEPGSISLFLRRELLELRDAVVRVDVIDLRSKRVIASNSPVAINENMSQLGVPWSREQLTFTPDPDVVRQSAVYQFDGAPVVSFVSPVPGSAGRAVVVTAEVDLVTDRFRSTTRDSFIQVVNGQRQVIVDQRGTSALEPYLRNDSATIVSRGLEGKTGFVTDLEKESALAGDYVAAYDGVDGIDWVVIVYMSADAAYELRQRITTQLLAIVLVAIVGLGLVGLTLGRDTVAALNALSRKARALEAGNLDVDLETDREDEIGVLFSSFAAMRDALRERIEELEESERMEAQARERLAEINADLEERKAIISVLNRLLTHNLRNGLLVIIGRAELLVDRLDGENRQEAETIHRRANRLLRRVEKSKEVETVVDTDPERLRGVDLPSVVEDAVSQFRDEYPDATITTDLPDEQGVKAGDAIGFIVYNLVENALEHNDRDEPTVHVAVDPPGPTADTTGTVDGGTESSTATTGAQRWVTLHIEDDGPGIPDMEIEALEAGRETQLRHGSGMGLWLVNWLVDHMNGDLEFRDRDPRGTAALVRLRPATARSGTGDTGATDPTAGTRRTDTSR